ncbi:MAG: hypothetical protein LBK82_02275 [Planctomycetaceae bacterium]|nr:hypothetical protein [Planctomycetaceae bacterium]
MTPKQKATPLAIIPLIPSRRVRRRDLSAKSRPPVGCFSVVKITYLFRHRGRSFWSEFPTLVPTE